MKTHDWCRSCGAFMTCRRGTEIRCQHCIVRLHGPGGPPPPLSQDSVVNSPEKDIPPSTEVPKWIPPWQRHDKDVQRTFAKRMEGTDEEDLEDPLRGPPPLSKEGSSTLVSNVSLEESTFMNGMESKKEEHASTVVASHIPNASSTTSSQSTQLLDSILPRKHMSSSSSSSSSNKRKSSSTLPLASYSAFSSSTTTAFSQPSPTVRTKKSPPKQQDDEFSSKQRSSSSPLPPTTAQERIQQLELENQQLHHQLFYLQSIPDVLLVFTEDGIIQYVSPSIESLVQYTPSALIGTSVWNLLCHESAVVTIHSANEALEVWNKTNKTTKSIRISQSVLELNLKDRMGLLRPMAMNAVVVFRNKRVEYVCSISRREHPRTKAEAEFAIVRWLNPLNATDGVRDVEMSHAGTNGTHMAPTIEAERQTKKRKIQEEKKCCQEMEDPGYDAQNSAGPEYQDSTVRNRSSDGDDTSRIMANGNDMDQEEESSKESIETSQNTVVAADTSEVESAMMLDVVNAH